MEFKYHNPICSLIVKTDMLKEASERTVPNGDYSMPLARNLPLVSVVVPAFNAETTLRDCLDALVAQDFPKHEYELIVVDNLSTDTTWSIIQSYGSLIQGLQETGVQSSYAARNVGVLASRGQLIAFTDADCVPNRSWLRLLVENFTRPEVGCVAGEVLPFRSETAVEKFSSQAGILRQRSTLIHRYRPYAQTANLIIRRRVFEQIGLFNSTLKSGGDADFCWRMQARSDWTFCFNDAAVVLHHHRSTVAGLWKQYVRYGQGHADLELLYNDYRERALTTMKLCVRKLIKLGRYAVRCMISILLMKKDRRKNFDALNFVFFDLVRHVAYACGKFRGSRKNSSTSVVMESAPRR